MADNDLKPMTDADTTPPPASTEFEPAAPLKDAHVEFGAEGSATTGSTTEQVRQTVRDGAAKYGDQVADRVRAFADTGKERAGGALDQLAQMLTDAAGQVDERLGAQYGEYAHSAAGAVQNLSGQVRDKNVDELIDDVRELVRKSPAVAVGAAAAFGFVVARVVQSGFDADRSKG